MSVFKQFMINRRLAYAKRMIERAKKQNKDHIEIDIPFKDKTLREKILFFLFISSRKQSLSFDEYLARAQDVSAHL